MFDYLAKTEEGSTVALLFSQTAENVSPPDHQDRVKVGKKYAAREVDLNFKPSSLLHICKQPCLIRMYYFPMS